MKKHKEAKMGKMQREKGVRLERELVNVLKDWDIPAERISPMEAGGIRKGDLLVAGVWKAEVKGGGMVPLWLYKARKEGEDMLFMKRDRRQWLVCMDLDWFLKKFL